MDREIAQQLVYSGLLTLMKNRKMFYSSRISSDHNHWQAEGKTALLEWTEKMSSIMLLIEERELKELAKAQTMEALKGEPI